MMCGATFASRVPERGEIHLTACYIAAPLKPFDPLVRRTSVWPYAFARPLPLSLRCFTVSRARHYMASRDKNPTPCVGCVWLVASP